MMRAVFDTNVYIAAALKGGFAEDILEMASSGEVVALLTSEEILAELSAKLTKKFHWTDEQAALFVGYIREMSETVVVTEQTSRIVRDPDDNKILSCAKSGKADIIITADTDLLTLHVFEGIAIIHPKTLYWTFPQYFKKLKK